jgi:hypothetical protein
MQKCSRFEEKQTRNILTGSKLLRGKPFNMTKFKRPTTWTHLKKDRSMIERDWRVLCKDKSIRTRVRQPKEKNEEYNQTSKGQEGEVAKSCSKNQFIDIFQKPLQIQVLSNRYEEESLLEQEDILTTRSMILTAQKCVEWLHLEEDEMEMDLSTNEHEKKRGNDDTIFLCPWF